MWLQAPLRDHWAQGDVGLQEIGLTLCVVGNSCTQFKQQVGGGRRVGWEHIRWPSRDASCCRSGLSLCRKAILPGAREGDCQFQRGVYYGVTNTQANKHLLYSTILPPAAGLPVQEQGRILDPMSQV